MQQLPAVPSRSERLGRVASGVPAVAWWVAGVWAALNIAVAANAPHADFFDAQVQLGAARDLLQGSDPYTRYVQNPLWTLLLLTPFALLDESLLYAGHFAGMLAMWFAAGVILLRAGGVPWGPVKTATGALVTCSYLPVMWSTHGQITAYHGLGVALCLALWRDRPVLAGAALVLTIAKPHLGLVPTGALLLWAATTGELRLLAGFGGALLGLVLASVGIRPQWIGQWVDAVVNPPPEVVVARAKFAPTVVHLAGRWLPGEVAAVLGVLAAAVTGGGLLRWLLGERGRLSPNAIVAVAVPATFLMTPYAQGYDLSLLAVAGVLLVGGWFRVQGERRRWLGIGLAGVYLFPYAVQLLGWPQAALLPSAVVCLALAAVNRDSLDGARGPAA